MLDFGISKAVSSERGITRTDAIMGSPGYMSPEQIRSAKHVDQRTDIWGLGIVLYELLTARPPFDGEHLAAMSVKIVLETPKPVDQLRGDVPRGLGAVVERCLAKEPDDRYQNMAELAEALLPYGQKELAPLVERIRRITRQSVPFAATISVDGETQLAQAGTAGGWERSRSPGQNKKKIMLGAALAALLLIGILVGVFMLGQRSGRDEEAARDTLPAATPSTAPASAPPAAISVQAPAAVSPALSADVPQPLSSAKKAPDKQPAVRTPRGPGCPKGQVATNGHCCPAGMVWQKGACDRPLATSLP